MANLQCSFIQTLSKTDSHIAHVNRMLSTTANVDTTLMTLSYTLRLLSSQLSLLNSVRLRHAAQSLAKKLAITAPDALLPGEAIIATISNSPTSRLVRAEGSSKALSVLIDDVRIFMRLWGLLGIWSWASGTYKSPPTDVPLKVIAWSQISACAAYQYLENRAYLASKGVLSAAPSSKIGKWYMWSCRFWMMHVALDFVRLARVRVLRRRAGKVSGGEEKEGKLEAVKEEAKWWRQAYVNAANAPLTVHWSLAEGFLSEVHVSVLSLIAGGLGLKNAWEESA
ncbi:MAG: hypothetical protein MMC33_004702 [Icmadophila ericetorum]|nr:hypothetical protein [Icmadophila ericetorum]